MTISGYTIPLEFEDNSFICSLFNQELEGKELSPRQVEVLMDVVGIKEDIEDLLNLTYVTMTTLMETYNYCDYHGDYMLQTKEIGYLNREIDFSSIVGDYNAADHGLITEVNRYSTGRELSVPTQLQGATGYFHIDTFNKAMKKVMNNRSKSVKSYNKAVRLAYKALSGTHITVDEENFLNNTRPKHF